MISVSCPNCDVEHHQFFDQIKVNGAMGTIINLYVIPKKQDP